MIIRLARFVILSSILVQLGVMLSPLTAAEPQTANAAFDEQSLEFFEREVRPLLIKRCYECHGPDAKKVKGGLLMNSRSALLTGGETGPAVVVGKPSESLLIDAINYGDLYEMPPKSKLPDNEIAILTKWVELGVPWPREDATNSNQSKKEFDLEKRKAEHWCWQPIREVAIPEVNHGQWPRKPLDYFVLKKLEEKDLSPSGPADRRTLIRRAYFDVIGLPPAPEAVEAFVNDSSPDAFKTVVDQLLQSEHFGERWARHWMDLVRYAETYGHEFDYPLPHATQYRDYLIRAFNADVRYDQFVTEHIAGDLLESPRLHPDEKYNESIIGTGFWWLGEATHAPVDVMEDEAGRVDNQIDVMTKTFLGVTVACARCHDHKFDAISTKDYYALSGFLKSSVRQEAFLDPYGRIQDTTEKMRAEASKGSEVLLGMMPDANEQLVSEMATFLLAARELLFSDEQRSVEDIAKEKSIDPARLNRWVEALKDESLKQPSHPMHVWLELAKHQDELQPHVVQQRKRWENESRKAAEILEKTPLIADFNGNSFGDWCVEGAAFGDSPIQADQWDAKLGGLSFTSGGVAHSGMLSGRHQGVLRSPTFTITHPHIIYRVAGENAQVRLILDSYFMDTYNGLLFGDFAFKVDTKGSFVWRRQAGDLGRYIGHRAHIEILDHGDGWVAVDEIRFSDGPTPSLQDNPLAGKLLADTSLTSQEALANAFAQLIGESFTQLKERSACNQRTELINWAMKYKLFKVDPASREQLAQLAIRIDDHAKSMPAPVRILAMGDGSGQNRRVYIRGNHRTLGSEAPRQLLTALASENQAAPESGSGRLELAKRMVDPANPLTSRVMVNRIWHHLTGRGIVASVDNFGVLGQRPTHPELLDHLALQFAKGEYSDSNPNAWSVKGLIREIMLSSTYQMSSKPNPEADQADSQNLLLHRMRIRRLEGEAIRDSILAISGRLDDKLYGGSVAVHITPFMQGRGRPGGNGPLDGAGRRSIYTTVRRNFLPPMMLAFDTPQPFNSVGRRNQSNVPAQALIMMNDPFVIEQSKIWAARVLSDKNPSAEERIRQMYLSAFSREPESQELADAVAFLAEQCDSYGLSGEESQTDVRVWADLCHVLMNVKEFIFIQ